MRGRVGGLHGRGAFNRGSSWNYILPTGLPSLAGCQPFGDAHLEARQHLFQPFFTTKTRGTGLGLAIARRIIDAHNGEIAVNADVADGTEIVIILPRKSP